MAKSNTNNRTQNITKISQKKLNLLQEKKNYLYVVSITKMESYYFVLKNKRTEKI